jgi:hypothetical protein
MYFEKKTTLNVMSKIKSEIEVQNIKIILGSNFDWI